MKKYAIYQREELVFIGTLKECAAHLKIKVSVLKYYLVKTYKKNQANRTVKKRRMRVVEL